MATIKIDTGVKVFDIENERGELLGQLKVNPSDLNFFTRADKFKKNIQSWIDDVNDIQNTELTEDLILEKLDEYDTNIKREVNELFDDPDASKIVFGNQNVFNTYNGTSFIERFLTAILPIIQNCLQEEAQKSADRVNKYKGMVSE